MPTIYDAFGRPVRTSDLRRELAGPTVTGVRSILSHHPWQGLTPSRLGTILREAEDGDPMDYLELAEEMEEKNLHYLSVLGTRKRQVAQLNITVEDADESPEANRDGDLVRDWLETQSLEDEFIDIMDALGKGFSVSEIMWDFSERQWMPVRLEYRDPRWFEFDDIDGRTLLLRDEANLQAELAPFKFVQHRFKAKSGLAVRGGFARMVAWFLLFSSYGYRDWAQFIETYGKPWRIGKYDRHATDQERGVLLRALTNLGSDAAAMIPESMLIELIEAKGSGQSSGSVQREFLEYTDSLISKAVLGQTLTTEAGDRGARSLGEVHDEVRHDIERSDATALAQTLTRDLVRPLVTLNHGERKRYPAIRIGREETIDIARVSDALAKLVPIGLRVSAKSVREKLDFEEPESDDDVLQAAAPAEPDAGNDPDNNDPNRNPDDDPDEGADEEDAMARALGRLVLANATRRGDAVDRAIDDLLAGDGWEPLMEPIIAPVLDAARTALARGDSLDTFREQLPEVFRAMDDTTLVEALHRMGFSARISGGAGLGDEGA